MPVFWLEYAHRGVTYVEAKDEHEARRKFEEARRNGQYDIREDGFTTITHIAVEDEHIAPVIS